MTVKRKREMKREDLTNTDFYDKLINMGYEYHHTSTSGGYVSRKVDYILTPYDGIFGKGFLVKQPRYDTTRYITVHYFIK